MLMRIMGRKAPPDSMTKRMKGVGRNSEAYKYLSETLQSKRFRQMLEEGAKIADDLAQENTDKSK